MARTTAILSLEEYDHLYGHQSGWEYWFGEARPKPVPTYLHGVLSLLLGDLLRLAGYFVSGESDLKVVPDWQPRPDVYGTLERIQEKYPTKPVDVVFEVLSKDDAPEIKCKEYTRIGVPQVFIFDPEEQTISEWNGQELVSVLDVKLENGVTVTGATIWRELEIRHKQRLTPPPSNII